MHYVCILKLANNSYHVGATADLRRRIRQHRQSNTKTTKRIRPKALVFYAAFNNKSKALSFERYLKSSSGLLLGGNGYSEDIDNFNLADVAQW